MFVGVAVAVVLVVAVAAVLLSGRGGKAPAIETTTVPGPDSGEIAVVKTLDPTLITEAQNSIAASLSELAGVGDVAANADLQTSAKSFVQAYTEFATNLRDRLQSAYDSSITDYSQAQSEEERAEIRRLRSYLQELAGREATKLQALKLLAEAYAQDPNREAFNKLVDQAVALINDTNAAGLTDIDTGRLECPPDTIGIEEVFKRTKLDDAQRHDFIRNADVDLLAVQTPVGAYRTLWFHPNLSPRACHLKLQYFEPLQSGTIPVRAHSLFPTRNDGFAASSQRFVFRMVRDGRTWTHRLIPRSELEAGFYATKGDMVAVVSLSAETQVPPRDQWYPRMWQAVEVDDFSGSNPVDYAYAKGNGYRGDTAKVYGLWQKRRDSILACYEQLDPETVTVPATWSANVAPLFDMSLLTSMVKATQEQLDGLSIDNVQRDLFEAALQQVTPDGLAAVPWLVDHRSEQSEDLVYLIEY